jgi:hypothetical protein
MGFARNIRTFWNDLTRTYVVQTLENELITLRSDMQQLRQDKDAVITELRADKAVLNAKVTMYERNINQRVGIDPTRTRTEKPSFPNFNSPPIMTAWQKQVAEHDKMLQQEEAKEA